MISAKNSPFHTAGTARKLWKTKANLWKIPAGFYPKNT